MSSTLDLKVVPIVDRAVELSGTDGGSIFYFREDIDRFQLGETAGLDEDVVALVRELDIAAGQTGLGEAIAKREALRAMVCSVRWSSSGVDPASSHQRLSASCRSGQFTMNMAEYARHR